VQQPPDTAFPARRDNLAREIDVRTLEPARTPAIVQNAHQVDDRVRATHEISQLRGLVYVDHGNFRGRQQDQAVLGAFAVPRRHAHAVARRGECMTDVPSYEPGSAENGNSINFHG
jgi:hypothetical protein